MSIVVKKIGSKKYAYSAFRRGNKVVHQYMGSVSDQKVAQKIERLKAEKHIPKNFHALFWDVNPRTIHIRKNAPYIIERVLEMGGLDALQWIQRLYPTKLIIDTCEMSRKISPKSKNFWEIWFRRNDAQ
jgi:hypothetical protein